MVERYWEPVEVSATELDYSRRLIPARYARNEAGADAGLDWDGRLPTHKPAFRWFLPTHDGDIWVIRDGPTEDIEDCDPSEMVPLPAGIRGPDQPRRCFRGSYIIDAFDAEGRYLGEVEFPGGGMPIPTLSYVRGDTLVTNSQDEAGTIMVKRYRLLLPDETQPWRSPCRSDWEDLPVRDKSEEPASRRASIIPFGNTSLAVIGKRGTGGFGLNLGGISQRFRRSAPESQRRKPIRL